MTIFLVLILNAKHQLTCLWNLTQIEYLFPYSCISRIIKKLVLGYRQYFANNRYIKNRLVYATIMYWWVYVCEVLSVFKHVILWFQTMSIESYYNKTCLGTRLFVVLYTYWNRFITPKADLHRVWGFEISKIFWVFTSIKIASKGCP